MLKEIDKVAEFSTTAGSSQEDDFTSYVLLDLKLGLIEEEVKELREAAVKGDRVEMLDALADILYVVYGFAWTYKFDEVLLEAFNRVHDSNMSKFPHTLDEVAATINNYSLQGIETDAKKVGDKFVVFRKVDGKILKSIDYKPVSLEDLC